MIGRGDSTSVVSRHDFDFLLSMLDKFQLRLGYEVNVSMAHQGTDPHIGTLFVSPYITRLVRGMGIL